MHKTPRQLYTAAQSRALDLAVIREYGIPGIELMSRAGNAVFRHLRMKWPGAQSVAIYCGSGNNAGDGYIVAGLAKAVGMKVSVYALSDPENLKDNALIAYQDYIKAKGEVIAFSPDRTESPDVIVDAIFGTGLSKPVGGLYAKAIEFINNSNTPVISVDIPSGLNADTGSIMGHAIEADCTVTFIGLKRGLYTSAAVDCCGDIIFASLAVPPSVFDHVDTNVHLVVKKALPVRKRSAHKGTCGHVLVIGGDQGYSGAARMAGEAALRVGAGLVSIATHHTHAGLLNVGRPELMCHGVEQISQLRPLLDKASVILIGPGLGQSKWAADLFVAAIKAEKPMVIDADALALLSHVNEKRENWVLTPHPGEAARLLGATSAFIQFDRFNAVSRIQAKYDGITVLKGAGTLIADSSGIAVSTTGNPGMASGGMGDVLAGIIAGLMAQGLPIAEAAQQGVFLHGMAADLSVEQYGERGLLASDLMHNLRQVVN